MRKRIATARGDLTGDGAPESLVLSGEQSAGSAYWQNIELEITDGRTGRTARVPLAHDGGYDPQLVLGSMTARDRVDALIALETGSSGAVGLYSVVAYQNGAYQTVFDSEQYAKRMRYRVQYLDQYVVRAESENTGMAYFIDLAGKDGDYLAQLYDENGVLRQPQTGFVDPVSLLYPGGREPRRAAGAGGVAEDQRAVSRGRAGRLHHDAGVERASFHADHADGRHFGVFEIFREKFLKAGNFFAASSV